jgi:hypothetical protein
VTKYADTLLGEQIGEVAQVAWEDYMDAIAAEQEASQEMVAALGLTDVSWDCFLICLGAQQAKKEAASKLGVAMAAYAAKSIGSEALAGTLGTIGIAATPVRVALCFCWCYMM